MVKIKVLSAIYCPINFKYVEYVMNTFMKKKVALLITFFVKFILSK